MTTESRINNFVLLNTGKAVHHGDWNWKNICSPFIRIHYIVKGTAKIIYNDSSVNLKEGMIYLTPSYKNHSYQCDGDLSLVYIHIYEATGSNLSIFDLADFPTEIKTDPLIKNLVYRLLKTNPNRELHNFDPKSYDYQSRLFQNIALQNKLPLSLEMETQGILNQLLARFLELASFENLDTDSRILKALHTIHQHISETISIGTLSSICALTNDHFIRLFKKEMGITPNKYIIQKKIERAQLLLLIRPVPVKELAYSLGFDNIPYFNRLFKHQTGNTPGSYRKKMHI
ncbi:helix-turn-helix domain-containing protein [Niabella hirudinis]|uniref:helix-turn-helix domain-containing protein n=1 Tax=Niabella hirudinis TaxID=1285929 RepID=UPI003EC145B5